MDGGYDDSAINHRGTVVTSHSLTRRSSTSLSSLALCILTWRGVAWDTYRPIIVLLTSPYGLCLEEIKKHLARSRSVRRVVVALVTYQKEAGISIPYTVYRILQVSIVCPLLSGACDDVHLRLTRTRTCCRLWPRPLPRHRRSARSEHLPSDPTFW